MKKNILHNQSGFTLVELMVSLSLFIIVVLALIGSLYTVNDASRRVQAMRTVMDNLNFAMEHMSRNIRTSEVIYCGSQLMSSVGNCPISGNAGPGTALSMHSTLGKQQLVEYRLNRPSVDGPWVIEKRNTELIPTPSGGQILNLPGVSGEWIAITSPEINIEKLNFYVDGAYEGDGIQPNVIIKMEGVAAIPDGTTVPFSVQTYLSQRTPEVYIGS
jgi:type II secretory pathway pseudopilin PulG